MTRPLSHSLPQLQGRIFLSEAGLETELIFLRDLELPFMTTFPLLESRTGRRMLREYFETVIEIARKARTGTVLETTTWRANGDWGARLGYTRRQVELINHDAVRLFAEMRASNPDVPVVISGNLGPRGDGYVPRAKMSGREALDYHRAQVRWLAEAGADLVSALTLNYSAEAIGVVLAAAEANVPSVVSFTVETNGALPSGQALDDAIREVDLATDEGAAYFMINCAHPDHFADLFGKPGPWHRLRGIRANASRLSHAELDNCEELDRGNETELACDYVRLAALLPQLAVVGGCCGTDLAHLQSISDAIFGASSPAISSGERDADDHRSAC